jgi:hypothetical protein
MKWFATSDAQAEYLVLQFSYTTGDIEGTRFSGEIPDPFYFVTPQPPVEIQPVVLTVIDGKPSVVKFAAPPGSQSPNPASRLFKLAETSVQAGDPA